MNYSGLWVNRLNLLYISCVIILLIFVSGHPMETLFVLEGDDLSMVIHGPTPVDQFLWRATIQLKKYTILTYQPGTEPKKYYGKRAEFSKTTFSLQIKNLRLNESGLYEAVVISATQDIVRVSPVVLNVSSVSLSPESCKVTVTCSTQSSSLNSTFTCTPRTCSEDGEDPAEVVTSDGSLQIYLSNGLNAVCNHSNKVSWSKATMEIKPLCFEDDDIPYINPQQGNLLIIIPFFLVILILVGILGAIYKQRKKSKLHFCHQFALNK
uniref:Immunoglobulin subtype domain-containing protein n=1 Tax=Gadus morhua TaxID=8049 RepID=A0A8C5B310_GADMO